MLERTLIHCWQFTVLAITVGLCWPTIECYIGDFQNTFETITIALEVRP